MSAEGVVLVAEEPIRVDDSELPNFTVERRAEDCPIVLVTLFDSIGEIQRLVTFDASTIGHYDVVVRGITTKAQLDRARINRGSGAATLLVMQASVKSIPVGCQTCVDAHLAERERLRGLIDQIDDEISVCVSKHVTVKAIAENSGSTAVPQAENASTQFLSPEYIENARKFLNFIQSDLTESGSRRMALIHQRSDLMKQLKEVQMLIDQAKKDSAKTEKVVEVKASFDVTEAGKISFALSYLVNDAYWKNKYEFWVNSKNSTLDLKCSALVFNKSGEDWPETALKLSTACPDDEPAPQEQTTTYVGFSHGSKLPPSIESHGDIVVGSGGGNGPSDATSLRMFEVKSHSVIEGDGNEHEMTALLLKDIPMEHFYSVAPRASEDVFNILSAKNTSNHVLLAGNVAVFIDGCFVCQSSLKCLAPGEPFEVCLGTDKDVKVEYSKPTPFDKTKGFGLFKKNITSFAGWIVATNNKVDSDITLRILDQLPLSNDTGIVVTLDKDTLQDKYPPKITEKNLLEWKFKLQPGEKVNIHNCFSVKYPGKRQVTYEWHN